jgi:hypothetical protein
MIYEINHPNLEEAIVTHMRKFPNFPFAPQEVAECFEGGFSLFPQYESDTISLNSNLRINHFCSSTRENFQRTLGLGCHKDAEYMHRPFYRKGSVIIVNGIPVGYLKLKEHRNYLGLAHIFDPQGNMMQMAGGIYSISPHITMGMPYLDNKHNWAGQEESQIELKPFIPLVVSSQANRIDQLFELYARTKEISDASIKKTIILTAPKTIWWEANRFLEQKYQEDSDFRFRIDNGHLCGGDFFTSSDVLTINPPNTFGTYFQNNIFATFVKETSELSRYTFLIKS